MQPPTLLALDFDGVLCDGLVEYFKTAWQAYRQLFHHEPKAPPEDLAERFYPLRPVIETGWEMPLLLHALQTNLPEAEILQDWPAIAQRLLADNGLSAQAAMAAVDGTRDRWIEADPDHWLQQHRFYPGVLDRLQQAIAAGVYPVIISTKEGRFIQQLLAQQGIAIAPAQILGKEVQRPKGETLRQLLQHPPAGTAEPVQIWFVEDRFKTLEKVRAQADLAAVELFLADWGYNTAAEKKAARHSDRIHLLSLSQLVQEFTAWGQ